MTENVGQVPKYSISDQVGIGCEAVGKDHDSRWQDIADLDAHGIVCGRLVRVTQSVSDYAARSNRSWTSLEDRKVRRAGTNTWFVYLNIPNCTSHLQRAAGIKMGAGGEPREKSNFSRIIVSDVYSKNIAPDAGRISDQCRPGSENDIWSKGCEAGQIFETRSGAAQVGKVHGNGLAASRMSAEPRLKVDSVFMGMNFICSYSPQCKSLRIMNNRG